jgi:hypothetical protein
MRCFYVLITKIVLLLTLTGCAAGHGDFVNFQNDRIGKKMPYKKVFKYENSGQLIRADFLISGHGLTSITTDKDGYLIYHFSIQEVLPNFGNKELIGKCLTYSVVEPKTYIIIAWGFEEGGNPLSCRTWS